jgi:hypothetical protein
MATLYIKEFSSDQLGQNGRFIPVPAEPAVATQQIVLSAAASPGLSFNSKTVFVELHTDGICSYKIATAPTAVITEGRMPANQTKYVGVGISGLKISAIINT